MLALLLRSPVLGRLAKARREKMLTAESDWGYG
eukprot:COSAG03_NODE_27270_length_254_cov_0.664516_1_plen_32_part_01